MPKHSRSIRTIVVAIVVLIVSSGCSILWPRPPDAIVGAVESALESLRALEGVATVVASVDDAYGADPQVAQGWVAEVRLEATPGGLLTVIVPAAEEIVERLRSAVPTRLSVSSSTGTSETAAVHTTIVLSGDRQAETTVLVTAAEQLRAIAGIDSVWLTDGGLPPELGIDSSKPWQEVVGDIRATSSFDDLGVISLSPSSTSEPWLGRISVDATAPSAELLALLERVVTANGATRLSFEGNRGSAPDGDLDDWRPAITAEIPTSRGATLAAAELAAFDDPDAMMPRPSFRIVGPTTAISGYVGLPPGSLEPEDLAPLVTPPPFDAAASSAQLEVDRDRVILMLDEAGELAGIAGEPSVSVVPCDVSPGSRVSGSVTIPIFEIQDSADEPFERITASWRDDGYHYSDRAMGLDFYDSGDSRRSIRGTAEGIRISETTDCTWP